MTLLARASILGSLLAATLAGCGAPTDSFSGGSLPPAADEPDGGAVDTGTGADSAIDDSAPASDATSEDTSDSSSSDSAVEAAPDAEPDATDGCDLPPRDCVGTTSYCGALLPFEPVKGPGYDNYPINGETSTNQYRSYARRDLIMLVKWASAFVACKAKGWTPGNGAPIGLGDMSEKSGAIPGTSIGSPGHPSGSHTNGYDMDIAYYQTTGTNNYLRAVCPHKSGGYDVYHCTGEPTILDVKRTALFLGAFLTSSRVRVIGVDGKIGPLVVPAMEKLCADGTLPKASCDVKSKIAYEVTDTGRGWYKFHHHHLHISLKKVYGDSSAGAFFSSSPELSSDLERLEREHAPGHAHLEE